MRKTIAFFLGALAFPFVANLFASQYYPGGRLFAQAPTDKGASTANLILLALLMIIGILSSFVFEKARRNPTSPLPALVRLKDIATDFQFIAALFVSPIIFNAVYSLYIRTLKG
jgi:hypothetical protein